MKSREGQEVAPEWVGGARVRTASREASGADGNGHWKGCGGGAWSGGCITTHHSGRWCFAFFWPCLWHLKVPRAGIEPTPQ